MTGEVAIGASHRPLRGSIRWNRTPPPERPSAPPLPVKLRALGPVEAVVADRLVDLGAPKQRALLALLVSQTGRPVAVDVIVEALWAGHPPPSARTSLQAYVANLRRVLEPDRAPRTRATVLRTSPQGYLLDSHAIDTDVQLFGERATAGWEAWDRGDARQALSQFEAGLALWRGQAYAEVADATYVTPEVARLEELRLSVAEARCAALLAVGAHEVAVAELEAFTQAHPLREYGCELLSLALYRAGRQADALGVLRTIQKRLAEELGVDPRPALRNLEREILNQDSALDWHPTPAAVAAATSPPPVAASDPLPAPTDSDLLVGREAAVGQLAEALAAAAAGRGQVVTVSGQPGIGKTSLLRRFADQVDAPVLWATCPEHVAAPPLWLWVQVLRAAGAYFPERPVPAPVAELLDGDAHQLADGADGTGATLRRFEAVVHYLTEASATTPIAVLLDNLHRADPSSLRLLAHLAESVPASRLLLAASYQSGEAANLAETLAAFARTGMTRIALTGLSAQDTRTLASTILHREISRQTAQRLGERTGGNPFFLRELLSAGEQCPERLPTAPVPASVREVVLRRIARLPDGAAEVLLVAAAAGRQFDIEVVAEAASVELEVALGSLDTAIAAGVVEEDQRRLGWFHFVQTMVAEALYETTGRLRRARLHRRIGAAAARVWAGSPEHAADIARHWLLAAELDPTAAARACAHAATAARLADARHAFEDAAALWRQALSAAGLAEKEDLDRHSLLIGLGTSLCRAGHPDDGLAAFIQAMEEALTEYDPRANPDTSRLVTAAVAALGELDWCPAGHGRLDKRLLDVVERALPKVTEPVHRSLLLSCLAVVRDHDRDPARRSAPSDEALALVRSTPDTSALAQVLRLRATALTGPDHLDQRARATTELLALPDLPPLPEVRARQFRAQVLVARGRPAEAAAELDLAAQLVGVDQPPIRARLGWSRPGLLLLGGHWREADELSRAAYDRYPAVTTGARFNRMVQRWEAAYLRGHGGDLVDELRAAAESTGLPALHSILVMALVEAGEVHDARTTLYRLPRVAKNCQWLYSRGWALLAASRLGETELATRLRAQLRPYRHLTCSVLDLAISGSVAYFTGEAAVALGDLDAAMADFAIAGETTQRMGARPWLAQVREAVQRVQRRLRCV